MIHLHRHSEYSRLDGVGTAQQYAERAKEMGQVALALTDHGTLSGALHHIVACREAGIVPISGVEAYYRPDRSVRDKEHRSAFHLCVFAKNLRGWHSLLRLTSTAYMENTDGGGFYQYPCVDIPLLREHHEGLIVSSGCISSYLSHSIQLGDDKLVRKYLMEMLGIFGDDFWFEIQPHDFEEQKMVNLETINLANEFGRPVVTTTDAHSPYQEWMKTQQVAKLMSTSSSYAKEAKRMEKDDAPDEGFAKLLPTAYLMDEKEIRKLYAKAHPNIPEHVVDGSIAATHDLAHSTTPFFLDRNDKLPHVSDSVEHSEEIMRSWCEEGLERVGKADDDEYRDRYEYEFGVMKEKGVLDYFILTGRVVRWAREQGIRTNVRGSAAGCLVSYLIGITHIDPIGWGLLFERFLNPGRKGLPDIDLDFQHDRRDEVKAWLAEQFGKDHVADIISHQTFAPKKVMIDVARTFDVDFQEVEELSKAIDIRADDEETTLEEIRSVNDTLDRFAEKYPEVWTHALRLEGTVANTSKHAAGVVITDKPITTYMPLERGHKGDQVTSWSDRADFPAVSDHGLVKLDMLGIKGLTKQDVALKLIEERHGVQVDLDNLGVLRDPRDVDPKVMEIFQQGLTLGIWQFGGRGITNLMKQIKPDWGGDMCAGNALYRPGPMGKGVTWEYADLKKNPDSVVYWDLSVQPILAETLGLIAYQEQVMEICKQLGGFTGGQADDMRKAMGKLYRLPGRQAQEFMAQFKDQWDKGTQENGLWFEIAEEIWGKILSFGGYGFNKSHSASYACQAYQDAYLKAYYPHEFYVGLLSYPPSQATRNADATSHFMQGIRRECEVLGVDFGPPHINLSDRHFSIDENDVLRFGLEDILDVGTAAVNAILRKRPFESWEEFKQMVPPKEANSKVRAGLIESGAGDCFGMRDAESGSQLAAWEKARLGIPLSMTSEIQEHKALLDEWTHTSEEIETLEEGREVVCGGDVIDISLTQIKRGKQKGQEMAFVTLAYGINQYRCTFFPGQWNAHRNLVNKGIPIMIAGKKNVWRGTTSVQVGQAVDLETWAQTIIEEEAAA